MCSTMKKLPNYVELLILASYFVFMFYGYIVATNPLIAATIAMCMSMVGIVFKLSTNKQAMLVSLTIIVATTLTGVYFGAIQICKYLQPHLTAPLQLITQPTLLTIAITVTWWLAVDWCHKSAYINDNNHHFKKEHI